MVDLICGVPAAADLAAVNSALDGGGVLGGARRLPFTRHVPGLVLIQFSAGFSSHGSSSASVTPVCPVHLVGWLVGGGGVHGFEMKHCVKLGLTHHLGHTKRKCIPELPQGQHLPNTDVDTVLVAAADDDADASYEFIESESTDINFLGLNGDDASAGAALLVILEEDSSLVGDDDTGENGDCTWAE
jgi:hypothetical protein